MGSSSKKSVIVGFRYSFDIHFGLGKAMDGLLAIRAAGKTAWTGLVTSNSRIHISAPNLFGGDKGEGGIDGDLDVMFGEEDQAVNSSLAAALGGLVPAFRGFCGGFFSGLVTSINPYPKPWEVLRWRALKGWDGDVWYPSTCLITLAGGQVRAMNPAHILYETYTNADWGRGLDRTMLDDAAFRAAALQLFNEGFGLCLEWERSGSLAELRDLVCDHIGAYAGPDRRTGLITLKLFRDDYDPEDLPLFDEDSGLLGIEEDEASSQLVAPSQLFVEFDDAITGEKRRARAVNPAVAQAQGGPAAEVISYPGLPTAELAGRVASRDMRVKASNLRKFKVRLDRRGWGLGPGDAFRVRSLKRGIEQIILRAGRIEDGTLSSGAITVTGLEDVFGLPANSFVAVPPSGYVPPDRTPQPVAIRRLVEAPYRELAGLIDPANLELLNANTSAAYVFSAAVRPSGLSLSYTLLTRVGSSGAFTERDTASWCPTGTLADILEPGAASAFLDNLIGGRDVQLGTAALVGDEICRVDAIDTETGAVSFGRGCADTVPTRHPAGTRVWFYDGNEGQDGTEYTSGLTIQARLLTNTSQGQLAQGSASTDSLSLQGRQGRPYPPGLLKINGTAYPAEVEGNITATWAHRDRISQADQLIDTTLGSIGPEASVTYTCRLLRADTNAVLLTQTGITGTSCNFVPDYGTYAGLMKLELWSVRGSLVSTQMHVHEFDAGPIEGMQELSVVNTSIQPPSGTASSISRIIQSSTAIGDLMLAFVMHFGPLTTVPAGWVLVTSVTGANDRLSVYKKIAAAGDPGASRTWSMSVSSRFSVHYVVLRGTEPLDVVAFSGEVSAAGVSNDPTPIASVAATAVGQVVLNTACQLANTSVPSSFTVSAPWTLRTNASSATQANRHGVATLTVGDLAPVEGEWTPSPANASSSWASISVVVGYAGS